MAYHTYTRYKHRGKILTSDNLLNTNNHYSTYEVQIESLPPIRPHHTQPTVAVAIVLGIDCLGRGLDGYETVERFGSIVPLWAAVPEAGTITALATAALFISAPYWSVALNRAIGQLFSPVKRRIADFHRWATQSYHQLRGR